MAAHGGFSRALAGALAAPAPPPSSFPLLFSPGGTSNCSAVSFEASQRAAAVQQAPPLHDIKVEVVEVHERWPGAAHMVPLQQLHEAPPAPPAAAYMMWHGACSEAASALPHRAASTPAALNTPAAPAHLPARHCTTPAEPAAAQLLPTTSGLPPLLPSLSLPAGLSGMLSGLPADLQDDGDLLGLLDLFGGDSGSGAGAGGDLW